LGTLPNPQSPIPNPQSPIPNYDLYNYFNKKNNLKINLNLSKINLIFSNINI